MTNTPQIIHHNAFTVIGFSEIFKFNEGFEKCPKFWDESYASRYARLFKTMEPENSEEQAVMHNRIGEFAVCQTLPELESFEYMICGEYRGGAVPENMKLFTVPESDWLEFRTKGPLPNSLQSLNSFVHEVWMKEHADEYRCRGLDIECYSAGNPLDENYECGICIPITYLNSAKTSEADTWQMLINEAQAVQGNWKLSPLVEAGGVAAAILTEAGNVYTGVCIDTASTLGMCAERNAIANMITHHEQHILKVVAIMPEGTFGAPCGACREMMMQIDPRNSNMEILMEFPEIKTVKLSELLPHWWGDKYL